MLKLALAAAISMMLVLEPAAAATRHKGHTAATKRVKVKGPAGKPNPRKV